MKQNKELKKVSGFNTASGVTGILGLVLCIMPYFAIVFSILAIAFYSIAKKKGEPTGFATAGLVTGIIGIVLNTIILLVLVAFVSMFGGLN